ncbi:MAG: acetate--CoA ligase family protein [Nocardioidaceae bacterium]
MSALEPLFAPKAITLVGASSSAAKVGAVMARQLATFPGPVLHVNARGPLPEEGRYPSVTAAVESTGVSPDLAILCVPAAATAAALLDCADAGARAALVCAAGFAESGPEGAAYEAQVAEVSRATGIRVLGPNTSGFVAPPRQLSACFLPGTGGLLPGGIAVVAASGGVNLALAFQLAEAGSGLALAVGLGNGADVTAADVLAHLAADPQVRAVALHVESVPDGRTLVDAIGRLVPTIPVAALVVGRSDVDDFARSHTGALATSWRTTRAALRQAGAVLVDDERELVEAVTALAAVRPAPGPAPGVGIVTAQAGPGLLLADGLRSTGVAVPDLADTTVDRIGRLLPPLTYQRNPVDTGRPGPGFPEVLAAVAADPAVDLLAVYGLMEPAAQDVAASIIDSKLETPAVAVLGGPTEQVSEARGCLGGAGVPAFTSPAAGTAAVRALVEHARASWRVQSMGESASSTVGPRVEGPLDEHAAKELLTSVGIRTPRRRVCASHDEAYHAFAEISGPVVAKILDPVVTHKTDIGGVRTGIRTRAELATALQALDAAGARRYLIEQAAEDGLELVVGAHRDPVFGPVVLLGLGGVVAEALEDVAVRLAPLSIAEARDMPHDLAAHAMFDGWRGAHPVDRAELAGVITAVGDVLVRSPAVTAVEINPLRVTPEGRLVALDAVILDGRVDLEEQHA